MGSARGEIGGFDMRFDDGRAEAVQRHAAAHEAQYMTKDLYAALVLHRDVIAAHPNTQEAEDSRTQIQNIVKGVVPAQVLLEEQVALALAYLEEEEEGEVPAGVEAAAIMPAATELIG
jgi:hypothetical protein